jgi:thioesterase domain-containing protein
MDVLLLDPAGRPVPAGEVGEIVVRSAYLAVGYWDRPDLTEAAFRPDPAGGGRRLYRTGDVGRMAADGCLEHLGRRDQQVKVRGERIDVEAIQAALLGTGVVREAVVTALRNGDGEARLVAYCVPARPPGPTTSELRRLLVGRLPGHPLPARFLLVEALPLDGNGKVDRRSLPVPDRTRPELDTPLAPPRTAQEAALAGMWADVLGLAPVGVEDDFFELGGDSLLAVEVLTRVAHAWGVEVTVSDFAERPTVAALAALADGAPAAAGAAAGGPPLFFLHSDYTGSGAECIRLARHLGPGLRLAALAPHDGGDGPAPPSIESLATAHLGRLRALQPRGPYRLAGHCSAGVVAFEMARQLHAAGEKIAALVLVEPPPLRAVKDREGRLRALGPGLSRRAWRRVRGLATRVRAAAAEGNLRGALGRALRARWSRPGHAHDPAPSPGGVERAYAAAVARYAPGRYAGRVTCVRTRASQAAGEFDPGSWREAVDRLDVEIVPGDHESCLTTEARTLAARLRECVEATARTDLPAL